MKRKNGRPEKNITQAERQEIIDLYASGKSSREVADATGWSPNAVCYQLRKAGVKTRKHKVVRSAARLTDAERAHILEHHADGIGSAKIAKLVGRSQTAVYRALKDAGVIRRRQSLAKRVESASVALQVAVVQRRPLERALDALVKALRGSYTRLEVDLEAMTYRATPSDEEGVIS